MDNILKDCEGCASKNVCLITGINNPFMVMCPCRSCVVKMVCQNACEEYEEVESESRHREWRADEESM